MTNLMTCSECGEEIELEEETEDWERGTTIECLSCGVSLEFNGSELVTGDEGKLPCHRCHRQFTGDVCRRCWSLNSKNEWVFIGGSGEDDS